MGRNGRNVTDARTAPDAGVIHSHSDYPDFFLNLYRLLDNQVLHVRYRPRFLRMLATFLSST